MIAEATGMVATLIVGGPEPAQAGRLQVIRYVVFSFYYGYNLSTV